MSESSDTGESASDEADSAEGAGHARRLTERSRRLLAEWSQVFLQGASQVAAESDSWFLATVSGLDKGARHTKAAVGRFGGYVLQRSSKLKPEWLRRKSQQERIHDMLMREAKRAKVDLSKSEFALFSQQIATIIELVLKGTISVDDIAFEQDERSNLLENAPKSDGSNERAQ